MQTAEAAKLVDSYLEKRSERLLKSKEVVKLEAEEAHLKQQLINLMVTSQAKSIGGSKGTVNHKRKYKPSVRSWDAVYAHIWQTKEFDLLQKRIAETAVKLRWEEKIPVPGVEAFPVDDLTISGEE